MDDFLCILPTDINRNILSVSIEYFTNTHTRVPTYWRAAPLGIEAEVVDTVKLIIKRKMTTGMGEYGGVVCTVAFVAEWSARGSGRRRGAHQSPAPAPAALLATVLQVSLVSFVHPTFV